MCSGVASSITSDECFRFIHGTSKLMTASVSPGKTPRLQVSVRAETTERNHELAMAVTELRDDTMNPIGDEAQLQTVDYERISAVDFSMTLFSSPMSFAIRKNTIANSRHNRIISRPEISVATKTM